MDHGVRRSRGHNGDLELGNGIRKGEEINLHHLGLITNPRDHILTQLLVEGKEIQRLREAKILIKGGRPLTETLSCILCRKSLRLGSKKHKGGKRARSARQSDSGGCKGRGKKDLTIYSWNLCGESHNEGTLARGKRGRFEEGM